MTSEAAFFIEIAHEDVESQCGAIDSIHGFLAAFGMELPNK